MHCTDGFHLVTFMMEQTKDTFLKRKFRRMQVREMKEKKKCFKEKYLIPTNIENQTTFIDIELVQQI